MPIYGLVDPARDKMIYPLVTKTQEHECLFAGKLKPALVENAPYIFTVDPNGDFMQVWQHHGWHDNWGILCRSDHSLKVVRRHFRNFLQAMLPDGDVVLFRFYDPRVWNTYLPGCNAEELAKWFDKVDEYQAPHPDGGGTVSYTLQNGQLMKQEFLA